MLVGDVASKDACVSILHIDHFHHLVVDGNARIRAQKLALYRLAIHVPVNLVGRGSAVRVTHKRHVFGHAHILILGLLDPVRLRLDDHLY